MVSRNADASQGEDGMTSGTSLSADQLRTHAGNAIFKSGPLFISSKGLGWTSWKKRWFILTRTLLVFYRSDPSSLPQRGGEANLALGGIDLNSSGSVIVRADKRLLTVLFPDGRDGRALTLKAETLEDLYEWKTALENALAQAPSATLVMGQTAIFRNDVPDGTEASFEQLSGNKRAAKSLVVGGPILLALEDIDGKPSFLEKALRFIEDFGMKVEGILRQSADVEEVERRVREYEQGKDEFSPEEDAHVIADCIKHVLRELPTAPVPAGCCTSLLEAFRSDRNSRVTAMRSVVSDNFPEPNRRLLQRILKMMRIVVSHKAENRMSASAVAACMAPLLLRPLLAGDCQFEDDFRMGGDGSVQLLQAAAAANHAQAIVITLLEEYHNIFLDASFTSEIDSDYEGSYTEDEEFTEDDEYPDHENDYDTESEEDPDRQLSGHYSGSSGSGDTASENSKEHNRCHSTKSFKVEFLGENVKTSEESYPLSPLDIKDFEVIDLGTESPAAIKHFESEEKPTAEHLHLIKASSGSHVESQNSRSSSSPPGVPPETLEYHGDSTSPKLVHRVANKYSSMSKPESCESSNINACLKISNPKARSFKKAPSIKKSVKKINETPSGKRPAWGRTSAKKNLSMDSIDVFTGDEIDVQKLENSKAELERKVARETEENIALQENLERSKCILYERRLGLEQEVVRLHEQLQTERDLRAALEAGLGLLRGPFTDTSNVDTKTRKELEEIAKAEADVAMLLEKVFDLHQQLNLERRSSQASIQHMTPLILQPKDVERLTPIEEEPASTNRSPVKSQQTISTSENPICSGPTMKELPSKKNDIDPPDKEISKCPEPAGWSTDSELEQKNETLSPTLSSNLKTPKSSLPEAGPTMVSELKSSDLVKDPSGLSNPKLTDPLTYTSPDPSLVDNPKSANSTSDAPTVSKSSSSSSAIVPTTSQRSTPKQETETTDPKGPELIIETTNATSRHQPFSKNKPPETSFSKGSGSKSKSSAPGSPADIFVTLPDVSPKKPTTASTEVSKNESLAIIPFEFGTKKSQSQNSRLSNEADLSTVAAAGSSKKFAGKEEGLVSSSTTASTNVSNESLAIIPFGFGTKKSKTQSYTLSHEDLPTAGASSFSKKLTGKEGGSSTLTRLTNRFNFKKERRSQSAEIPAPAEPLSEAAIQDPKPLAPPRTNSG